MTDLDEVVELIKVDSGLAVVSITRADGTIHSSVVNAGVLPHPMSGQRVVAYVTYGKVKLTNLRARPRTNVTIRAGWQWRNVEGTAELIGPDDPHPDVDAERLRVLLREIFIAAGGTHDDWDAYDRTMVKDARTAVLVTPARIYGN